MRILNEKFLIPLAVFKVWCKEFEKEQKEIEKAKLEATLQGDN